MENFETLYEIGRKSAQAGRFAEAVPVLENALRMKPGNEKILNVLGLCYFKSENFEKAEKIYRILVQSNPQVATLHLNLGIIYVKTGRWTEAEVHLEKARALEPRHSKALLYLGLVYEKRGQLERALEHYEKAGAAKQADKLRGLIAQKTPKQDDRDTLKIKVSPTFISKQAVKDARESADNPLADGDILGLAQEAAGALLQGAGVTEEPKKIAPAPRIFSPSDTALPDDCEYLSQGQVLKVQVKNKFFVFEGFTFALGGWLRAAHSSVTRRIIALDGEGEVLLRSKEGAIHIVSGNLQNAHIDEKCLVGFSDGFQFAERKFSEHNFIALDGRGLVFIRSLLPPLLEPLERLPFNVPPERLLAWSAQKYPEITPHNIALGTSKNIFRFISGGFVLLGGI